MAGRRVNTNDRREAAAAVARKPGRSNQAAKSSSSASRRANSKRSPSNQTGAGRGDHAAAADNAPIRLQRLLASAGFGSRRACEELITEGRVQVNGETVSKLGTTVDPDDDKIKVDGTLLRPQRLVYFAVNKPVGVVTTNRDPQGRPRVVDLVPPTERVFPVGRLDRSSEGLILVTNDGELAQRLTHPKYQIRKIYRVMVAGKVDPESMRQMRKGIHITEGLVKVEGVKLIKARAKVTELEIVLSEGKNREIRRILARLGHKVMTLRRVAVGPLRLGDVPPGAYRTLARDEVAKLYRIVEQSEMAAAAAERDGTAKSVQTKRRTGATRRPGGRDAAVGRRPTGAAAKKAGSQNTGGQNTGGRKTGGRKPVGRKPGGGVAGKFGGKPKRRPPTNSSITITSAPGQTTTPAGGIVIAEDAKPAGENKPGRDTTAKRSRPAGGGKRSAGGGKRPAPGRKKRPSR